MSEKNTNQLVSEMESKIRHWDERSIEEKILLAERVIASSMLSDRANVRLMAARTILERYTKPSGLPDSVGAGDIFGEDEETFPSLARASSRPRKAL